MMEPGPQRSGLLRVTNPDGFLLRTLGMATTTTSLPARGTTLRTLAVGLTAAALGVGVGELFGGLVARAGSPVVAVGGLVIDNVPPAVKDWAIENLGKNDKVALVAGTLIILAGLGAGLALVARRRPSVAVVVVILVSLVGVIATKSQTLAGPVEAAIPSLVGAAAAIVALALLRSRAAGVPAPATTSEDARDGGADRTHLDDFVDGLPPRRDFLIGTGGTLLVAGAAAAGGRVLQGRNGAGASRSAVVLPEPVERLPKIPAGTSVGVNGVAPFVTTNGSFYRVDKNITPLQVRTEGYVLRIDGMVDRPFEITWKELLARPMREYDLTMTCVSNLVGGNLVGSARWLGFPLRELLDEAGVQDGADQVVGRSADDYTGGFPTAAAYDRDSIVAIGMNGEPLPIRNGFPVRLVVPGLYGYIGSVKWLTRIELTTMDGFDAYWIRRDYAKEAPVKTMTRIDAPRNLSKPAAGEVMVAGVAWAQTRGISKVEVLVDDGEWTEARLGEALNEDTWRQFVLPVQLDAGLHTVKVRATDGNGDLQTEERASPLPNGASGWHTIRLNVQ